MLITNSLELPAPPDRVFETLVDLDAVAPCIPGATLGAADGNGGRDATIDVAFGPMRFHYVGSVRIVSTKAEDRLAVLEAQARETSGEGRAKAEISMRVSPSNGNSDVEISTDLQITGGIAQIGRGMIEEVAQELLEQFAECLARLMVHEEQSTTAEPPPAAVSAPGPRPVHGVSLLRRALIRRVRRLLRGRS